MPDTRRHRGPHPEDEKLFAVAMLPRLVAATDDLCWLLTREYSLPSALKLVGDRYDLTRRQRIAVGRVAASAEAIAARSGSRVNPANIAGCELWIDGYNVLTTVEAALSNGVVLRARDGCFRDMASMHGSYRKVAETVPALELIGQTIAAWPVAAVRWFLDRPVSNSGRLKTLLRDLAASRGWNWHAELVPNPDNQLSVTDQAVATADSAILDKTGRWVNLARLVVETHVPGARVIAL